MACGVCLSWLMLAVSWPLITGAPSQKDGSCPKDNLNITGGSFVLSRDYSDKSVLKYICPSGFYPSVPMRQCIYGLWTPKLTRKPAVCKMITCPNPRSFVNGEVAPYKERYNVNDKTSYTCHSDYSFRGSAFRVCKANGKWSGSTPICGRDSDHCPDPGVPPGATRTGNVFNIDSKVTYYCDKPLTLIGSKERVCQDGGHWSGTEPQCYDIFTYDTPEEAAEAFSSSLKTNLAVYQEQEGTLLHGKKLSMDEGGILDIYIAVDASDSIEEEDFDKVKSVIRTLIEKISDYQVSPNYEILMFATEVTTIFSMRNFKRGKKDDKTNKVLQDLLSNLENFEYDSKGDRAGTNIAKAYASILESMKIEQLNNTETFLQTHHVVIMFTDGHSNEGGVPKPKVDHIKHLVIKNDPNREKNLDLYVFGVGKDVYKDDVNDLISQRPKETHFFLLPDLQNVQETFDSMIDESTRVGLCGMYHDQYTKNDNYGTKYKRRAYPWLAQIEISRLPKKSTCMGSLVTSSFILTAAHCFKDGDKTENIAIKLEKNTDVKVDRFITHKDYDITAKRDKGILEYYEYDVALIKLKVPVEMGVNIRPICIPCTKQTSGALKLHDSKATCAKHEELIMNTELVEASFTSEMQEDNLPRKLRTITIKRGKWRDACVEDAKKAKGMNTTNAKEIVSENFLCSGGTEPKTDDVSCKGESGGATYLNYERRTIQIGIVSWGVKDKCTERKRDHVSDAVSRDYHTNLFSPKIQEFLKEYLGNGSLGEPLDFL